MEGKYTKGEWYSSKGNYPTIETSDIDTYHSICAINTTNIERSEIEANAKLIACAPEMLGMLVAIHSQYDKGTETYKLLTELIQKATTL